MAWPSRMAASRGSRPPWLPYSGWPSRSVLTLVPEAATQKHLEILSEIAELLSDSQLRESIKASRSGEILHQQIAQWHSAHLA